MGFWGFGGAVAAPARSGHMWPQRDGASVLTSAPSRRARVTACPAAAPGGSSGLRQLEADRCAPRARLRITRRTTQPPGLNSAHTQVRRLRRARSGNASTWKLRIGLPLHRRGGAGVLPCAGIRELPKRCKVPGEAAPPGRKRAGSRRAEVTSAAAQRTDVVVLPPHARRTRRCQRSSSRRASEPPRALNRLHHVRRRLRPDAHHDVLSLCGIATEVPFVPDGVRPVFCLPCLKQTR